MAIVGGAARASHDDNLYHLGFIQDNQNLVAASQLIISLAGKSTIDEANSYGVPIIAIPLKNHFEQERNARSLGFTYDDIHRLDSLMIDGLQKTLAPQNYQGSNIAAEVLASLTRTTDEA